MFGLSLGSIKWIAAGIILAVLLAIVGGFWLNYKHLQDAYATAQANAATAKAAFAAEQATTQALQQQTAELRDRIAKAEETARQIDAAYQANAADLRSLRAKLAKHDLERLTDAKPKLVQDAINRGTADAWRLLQCAGRTTSDCAGPGAPAAARTRPASPAARAAAASP